MRSGATLHCATCFISTSSPAASGSPNAACLRCRSRSTKTIATNSPMPSRNSRRPAPRCSTILIDGEPAGSGLKGRARRNAGGPNLVAPLLELDAEFADQRFLGASYVSNDSTLPPQKFQAGIDERDRAPDQIDMS